MMDRNQEAFKTAALIRDIYARCSSQIASGMAGSGFSHQQIMVIRLLAHNKTLDISSLCQEMALTKGTVSGIVNRLVQAGYIEKYKNPQLKDQRNTYIRFTPEGQAFAQSFRQKIMESYTRIFVNYSDEALLQLEMTLREISQKIPKHEPTPSEE